MNVALGLAWGAGAGLRLVVVARRRGVRARASSLRAAEPARAGGAAGPRLRAAASALLGSPFVRALHRLATVPSRRRRARRDESTLRRELPVAVDLVRVGVGAGCTPFLAVEHAARFGPPHCAAGLRRVTRECALGRPLDDALRGLGADAPVLVGLTDALRTSARLGTPALPALARVAGDVRADNRRRAESRARTVPVRLCFPLVVCILPAFALLTVVPVVLAGTRG